MRLGKKIYTIRMNKKIILIIMPLVAVIFAKYLLLAQLSLTSAILQSFIAFILVLAIYAVTKIIFSQTLKKDSYYIPLIISCLIVLTVYFDIFGVIGIASSIIISKKYH